MRRADLESEALYEISRVLQFSQDINKALTSVLSILRLVLGMENGTVSLFDPVTGEVFIEAAPEMSDAERILGRLRPGEGLIGRIFQTGMSMVVPDMAAEPLFLNRTGSWRNLEEDPRAFLGVPIRDARLTLGVLTVDRPYRLGPSTFDRDLRLLAIVASMVGARVRLQQLADPAQRPGAEESAAPPAMDRLPGIVTASARMRDILESTARVAQSRATVLLRGESGTGKELFARAVHDASPRAGRPFVALNCAAIPETLAESELFGHEKGAFTGAAQAQKGRFEQADGGTLFLDEVGELPQQAQAKLLRVLQERQFERLGGRKPVTVDVRLVAATNRDLEDAVRRGQFRLDLYHRLSVVTVMLPPLRERPEDVVPLAEHFLKQVNEENGRSVRLSSAALAELRGCRWSGNVRQLRNCIERMVVSTGASLIDVDDLSCGGCLLETLEAPAALTLLGEGSHAPAPAPRPPARGGPEARPSGASATPAEAAEAPGDPGTVEERERIIQALARAGHVQAKAARILGMTVRQLGYRIRKYGIPVERF